MSTARNFMRNRNDRKYQRREEGAERLEYWQSKSPKEQLEALDNRLGPGVGATKQRKRLQALLNVQEPKKEKKDE